AVVSPHDSETRHRPTARHRADGAAGDRVTVVSGSAGSPDASGPASRTVSRTVSRRVALALAGTVGLVGAGALGGCDLRPGSSSPAAVPPPDPAQRGVDAARGELGALLTRLQATTGTSSLVACPGAQLAALQGEPPPATRRARPFTRGQLMARERLAAQRF